MADLPRIKDGAPIYGMNTRDDAKDIKDGECLELVNAYPGNPPIPRKGCRHHKVSSTENFDFASHAVPFVTASGSKFAVLWVKSGTDYKLIKINLQTRLLTVLGTATGMTAPSFHLIHVFDYIYSTTDEDMYWEGSTRLSRHKIIEIGDDDRTDIVREMCINVEAQVSAVTKITGTTFSDGYFGYAFTFIRHVAEAAFDADGNPQEVTAYYPGVNEGPEDIDNRIVAGGDGNFGLKIEFDLENTDYFYAIEQGATHIRAYRTRKQVDPLEAAGATHFFLKDYPIPNGLIGRPIVNIQLPSNNLTAFSRLHGFSNGNAIFFGDEEVLGVPQNENNDLNDKVKAIVKVNEDYFTVSNTSDKTYIATNPGKASQDYVSILSFNLTGTKVRITTASAHGYTGGETIRVRAVTNGNGSLDGELYKQNYPAQELIDPANPSLGYHTVVKQKMVQSGHWDGINSIIDTITVIDATTVEFDTVLSASYKKPFYTIYGTPIYTDAELTPDFSDGVLIKDIISITSFSTPSNNVVIETETTGILVGNYVKIDSVVGSTQLNGNTYKVLTVGATSLKINLSTTGISAYNAGGTITPSTHPIDGTDTITDASLAGETAQLTATNYSAAPLSGRCEYAATRLFLFGLLTTEKGRAYYSEFPGGDGGTPLEAAHTYPQKFLSWYNYNYYMDFSVKKGFLPTGIKRLSNDLYFFFEGEIYALFGSDPTTNTPSLISEEIGCAFPESLIIGELPIFGGQCLLYLSNLGPAITLKGGETFLFTNFKIAQLWPDKDRELYDDLYNHRDHIITHCFSEYWDNTWWINYTTYAGVHRIWGHYFNPELKLNQKASQGAFEMQLAEV